MKCGLSQVPFLPLFPTSLSSQRVIILKIEDGQWDLSFPQPQHSWKILVIPNDFQNLNEEGIKKSQLFNWLKNPTYSLLILGKLTCIIKQPFEFHGPVVRVRLGSF